LDVRRQIERGPIGGVGPIGLGARQARRGLQGHAGEILREAGAGKIFAEPTIAPLLTQQMATPARMASACGPASGASSAFIRASKARDVTPTS
jgi:hypothetical protein